MLSVDASIGGVARILYINISVLYCISAFEFKSYSY